MHTAAPMPVWTFALSAAAVVSRWLAHTGALAGLTAASTAITASILLRAPLDPTLALVAFAVMRGSSKSKKSNGGGSGTAKVNIDDNQARAYLITPLAGSARLS